MIQIAVKRIGKKRNKKRITPPSAFSPQKHGNALTVPPVALGVEPLPGLPATSSRLVIAMTLVETAALLTGSSQPTRFTVLVDWLGNPVDARITADGLVLRVNEDDFKVFVGGVLVYPVGVCHKSINFQYQVTLRCKAILKTRKFAQRRPTRSSAVERRER